MEVINNTVAIVGVGYVGLPLALAFGRHLDTIGFDISEAGLLADREGHDSTGEIAAVVAAVAHDAV